ncbi:MAG: argininosuccinate synthase [Thermoleophilales bacterium]|nr:argininosuccinate synthase [Thermoleophilales bacterium]
MGAVETVVIDAREEHAEDFVLPAISALTPGRRRLPLFTSLGGGSLIGKLGVEVAAQCGCDTRRSRLTRQGQRPGPSLKERSPP